MTRSRMSSLALVTLVTFMPLARAAPLIVSVAPRTQGGRDAAGCARSAAPHFRGRRVRLAVLGCVAGSPWRGAGGALRGAARVRGPGRPARVAAVPALRDDRPAVARHRVPDL